MTYWETVWTFKTARFTVEFSVAPEDDLDLSWDEDGSTREGLESGKYVAFVARVRVLMDGREIGADYLGECIYKSVREFRTAHRDPDPDPMNRNSSVMIAARGNISICQFPSMVAQAIDEARKTLCAAPRMRCAP
jgi:hypothetical protein